MLYWSKSKTHIEEKKMKIIFPKLKKMQKKGVDIIGVYPSEEVVKIIRRKSEPSIRETIGNPQRKVIIAEINENTVTFSYSTAGKRPYLYSCGFKWDGEMVEPSLQGLGEEEAGIIEKNLAQLPQDQEFEEEMIEEGCIEEKRKIEGVWVSFWRKKE